MNSSDPFEQFLSILLYSYIAFFFIFKWVFNRISEKARENVTYILFISSPLWLVLSIYQLINRLPLIWNGTFNIASDFFTLLSFFVLFSVYLILAIYPATFASVVIKSLRKIFFQAKVGLSSFWYLLSRVKVMRFIMLLFLFILLLLTGFVDLWLLMDFLKKLSNFNSAFSYMLSIFIFLLLATYLIFELFKYGKVKISSCQHKKAIELKRAIENISITAQVEQPDFQILSHTNPTSFLLWPNFEKPTLYITNSLLSMANKNELEAVVAHELASLYSGRILDYKRINNLLLILRTLSFMFFLLLLLSLDLVLFIFWSAYVIYFVLIPDVEERMWFGDTVSASGAITALLNPPYLFINFISYFIYYSLTYSDVFYADLKALQFTRYPKGLYSILKKIEKYSGMKARLPREYYYLYFTGEAVPSRRIPMPQPSLEMRKTLLEDIDYTLSHFKISEKRDDVLCPQCRKPMEQLEGKRHYSGNILIDHCPICGSMWFDNWELYYIADLASLVRDKAVAKKKDKIIKKEKLGRDRFLCPHCGTQLHKLFDSMIPKEIQIFKCSSCRGNWLERADFLEYSEYKKRLRK